MADKKLKIDLDNCEGKYIDRKVKCKQGNSEKES